MDNVPSVMTPDQVARCLQVNPQTVYRYIRQGKLSASRLGRAYRITRESVDRLPAAFAPTRGLPNAGLAGAGNLRRVFGHVWLLSAREDLAGVE